MNYCSISDAWGNKNNNIENFQPHNNIEKLNLELMLKKLKKYS